MNRKNKITHQQIIDIAKKIFNNNPNIERCEFYNEIKKYGISRKLCFIRFGKLDNLANHCGFVFNRQIRYKIKNKYSKEFIAKELKRVFDKYKDLTVKDIKTLHKKGEINCGVDVIRRYFININNAADYIDYKITTKQERTKTKNLKKLKEVFGNNKILMKKEIFKKSNIHNHTFIKYFGSLENAANKIGCKIIPSIRIFKEGFNNIGKNETKILDYIESKNNIKLIRQHPVYTYFVDGYDKENNIVYEVDEYHHKFRKEYDNKRENKIKNILDCKFIRIKENNILKQMEAI